MKELLWRCRSCLLAALTVCCLYLMNLSFCCSINEEGLAVLRLEEKVASEPYGDLTNWKDEVGLENPYGNSGETEHMAHRKLLQRSSPVLKYHIPPPPSRALPLPLPLPPPSPLPPDDVIRAPPPDSFSPPALDPLPSPDPPPSPELAIPPPSPSPNTLVSPPSISPPAARTDAPSRSWIKRKRTLLFAATGSFLLLLSISGVFLFYYCKMATVKPWPTGLSGQLQRAFVTGVSKLKRSELVAACEDFSNVIGSSSVFTLYKGTLSSGIEIVVASAGVTSAKEWPNNLEAHFRKEMDTLSKVNHKNFICLLGYCVEREPFTRMLVFEYAPNGTLFEHLHIREAEHLDWAMRLRIAMGIAYCLEHMHQLSPALPHRNLTSSYVYLSEDYAGKVSNFIFDNDGTAAELEPSTRRNVYSFGVLLFEMISGRLPYSGSGDSPENWASDYLRLQHLQEVVDPYLRSYNKDQLQLIGDVIKLCTNPDPRRRPSMKEACVNMREITGIGPDEATPKLSPLWWAELEILSTEAN